MIKLGINTAILIQSLIERHNTMYPPSSTSFTGKQTTEINEFINECIKTQQKGGDPKEGNVMLVMMTEKLYDSIAQDSADTEGWLHNCLCGHSFIAQSRRGKCSQCFLRYEILSNRQELTP